jgi:hypothetical protein
MPRVTAALRRQWNDQIEQAIEEREVTQSGQRRSPEDIAIVDFDIRVMRKLLSFPIGTKFDAQEIQKQMLALEASRG